MRFKRSALLIFLSILFLSLVAGCGGGKDPAAAAVEAYLQALVGQDSARLSNGVCAAWEPDALTELDAFQGVTASLDGVTCAKQGDAGAEALVDCTGRILATYNNEQQELPVSGRTYRVVQEGGEWRVCGYR